MRWSGQSPFSIAIKNTRTPRQVVHATESNPLLPPAPPPKDVTLLLPCTGVLRSYEQQWLLPLKETKGVCGYQNTFTPGWERSKGNTDEFSTTNDYNASCKKKGELFFCFSQETVEREREEQHRANDRSACCLSGCVVQCFDGSGRQPALVANASITVF